MAKDKTEVSGKAIRDALKQAEKAEQAARLAALESKVKDAREKAKADPE